MIQISKVVFTFTKMYRFNNELNGMNNGSKEYLHLPRCTSLTVAKQNGDEGSGGYQTNKRANWLTESKQKENEAVKHKKEILNQNQKAVFPKDSTHIKT